MKPLRKNETVNNQHEQLKKKCMSEGVKNLRWISGHANLMLAEMQCESWNEFKREKNGKKLEAGILSVFFGLFKECPNS